MPDKSLTVDPAIEAFECLRRRAEHLWPGFGSRVCVREEYEEQVRIIKGACPAGNRSELLKIWAFHYSDGTEETVTTRTRQP